MTPNVSTSISFNKVLLTAKLAQISPLRYTPAGLAVVEMQLEHLIEGPSSVDASVTVEAIAFSLLAQSLAGQLLGTPLSVRGFLRHAGRSKRLMLQVEQYERMDQQIGSQSDTQQSVPSDL